MAEGESIAKKRKKRAVSEEELAIFRIFLNNENKRYQLEQALVSLKRGLGMNLACLQIDDSNARSSVSFSEATVRCSVINPDKLHTEDDVKGFPIGDIFADGMNVLEHFLDKTKPQVPGYSDAPKQKALLLLLKFLSEDHAVLLKEQNSSAQKSVTIAQHLLSKLAFNSNYTVASSPDLTLEGKPLCPCKEKDQLIGNIGDTSYGCQDGWHGSSDIIMEDNLPVSVFENRDKDNLVDEEDESDTPIEIELEESFMDKDVHQIISQTVVFSFLQRKVNKGRQKNSLVPGIGISGNNMLIYFYDCENDVLLATKPKQFIESNTLLTVPIVLLWLTLNYRLFCTGVTKNMKACKADFLKRDDCLKMYAENVERLMHVPETTVKNLFPWINESYQSENVEGSQITYEKLDF